MSVPVLKLRNINKQFNNNYTLQNINIDIFSGETHTIVGENGAGKSTLMKIISGIYSPDNGEIIWQGEPIEISSPNQAHNLGIITIYQEPNLFSGLSVTENLYLHKWKQGLQVINWNELYRKSENLLKCFGMNVDSHTPVGNLGLAEKQMIEIIRAFNQDCKLIILDEATAGLSMPEFELVKNVIEEISAMGVAIFFVSQRPENLQQIGDRVSIMREGEIVETNNVSRVSAEEVIQKMAEDEFSERYPKISVDKGYEVLRVDNLSGPNQLHDINFKIYKNEIVGLYGMMGSGRTLLGRTLFGLLPVEKGQIYIEGKPVINYDHEKAIKRGLCYVPEDRIKQGLFISRTVRENITITHLDRFINYGLINVKKEKVICNEYLSSLAIKSDGPDSKVFTLSGGNQQKLVLAKWFNYGAKTFILDEPTRGIDIANKTDVYNIINKLILSGASIFLISSDINELLGMCDRILIINNGTIVREVYHSNTTVKEILKIACTYDGDE